MCSRAERSRASRRISARVAGKRPHYALDDVFEKAEELSRKFTAATGCRSLDILHVAAALVLEIRDFVTFDVRQARVARKARLRVRPTKRG